MISLYIIMTRYPGDFCAVSTELRRTKSAQG